MRWDWITALGDPVVPEVNRNLATVSGPTAAWARSTSAVASVRASAAKPTVRRPAIGFSATTTGTPSSTAAAIARA